MTSSRYPVGRYFEIDSIKYRVVAGNRCEGDKAIEFSTDGGRQWTRPPISHMVVLFNCKMEVEENNYGVNGKITSGSGKWMLYHAILSGMDYGVEAIAERIKKQRENRKQLSAKVGRVDWDVEAPF